MSYQNEGETFYAYLGIYGVGRSSKITERLGMEPDKEWSQGDPWVVRGREMHKPRSNTFRQADSYLPDTAPLEVHITAILNRISDKREAIQSLKPEYWVGIVCTGTCTQSFQFLVGLDRIRRLSEFGLELKFDIYGARSAHEIICDLRDRLRESGLDDTLPDPSEM